MLSINKYWRESVQQLETLYSRSESESIIFRLFEDLFGVSRTDILVDAPTGFDPDHLSSALTRLLQGEPLQHILGKQFFLNRWFNVNKSVLIPRPETEELVRLIVDRSDSDKPRILDVGTGSGCIAVSLALELGAQVFATDVSSEALEVAKQNSTQLGGQVTFVESDVLVENFPVTSLDIVVSNPPYIPNADRAEMHKNVTDYEPETALFVEDHDPLIFYEVIAEKAIENLNQGGALYFEIHEAFAKEVVGILKVAGLKSIGVFKDFQGKNRMVRGMKPM